MIVTLPVEFSFLQGYTPGIVVRREYRKFHVFCAFRSGSKVNYAERSLCGADRDKERPIYGMPSAAVHLICTDCAALLALYITLIKGDYTP